MNILAYTFEERGYGFYLKSTSIKLITRKSS